MKYGIITALLLAALFAQAKDASDATFERLAKVDRFAFGGIGYAGVISQGEKDYKIILSRPSATADFERLLSAGNLQAKCYALMGIHAVNLNRFRELSHLLRDSKEMVSTERGCIVSYESLTSILTRIEAGEYSKMK